MFGGNIKIAKVNVDESPQTAQRFKVLSIPTLIFFKAGQPDGQFVGVNQKDSLRRKIDGLSGA